MSDTDQHRGVNRSADELMRAQLEEPDELAVDRLYQQTMRLRSNPDRGPIEDLRVMRMIDFFDALDQCSYRERPLLKKTFPGLYEACIVHARAEDMRNIHIKCGVLGAAHPSEIAEYTGLDAMTVQLYEVYFWNLRNHVEAKRDGLIFTILRKSDGHVVYDWNDDLLKMMAAYHTGWDSYKIIAGFRPGGEELITFYLDLLKRQEMMKVVRAAGIEVVDALTAPDIIGRFKGILPWLASQRGGDMGGESYAGVQKLFQRHFELKPAYQTPEEAEQQTEVNEFCPLLVGGGSADETTDG